MKCLVVGAGNAGRPTARILNHVGHLVTITDAKSLEDFPLHIQEILTQMEKEGVILHLDSDTPHDLDGIEACYLSPKIPSDAPIRNLLEKNNIAELNSKDISRIINQCLGLDVIGITGTLGKTSTTHLISEILEFAGFDVWTCSSLQSNLLSEIIVEGIVKGLPKEKEVAVLELPHGTSRLTSEVDLKVGLLTNIYPEHLAEFDGSMKKYVERKMLIAGSSEALVTCINCKDTIEKIRDDAVYFSFKTPHPDCHFFGNMEDKLKIEYCWNGIKEEWDSYFHLPGYYQPNTIAAAAVAIVYGIEPLKVQESLSNLKGIPAHMEYLGNFCEREAYFDAAYLPEGMQPTLECFSGKDLIVIIDNPDSSTPRDKTRIGQVLGKYAKVIISSGFNETMKKLDMLAAQEVLEGANDSNAVKIAVKDIETAALLAMKHSKPGDTILHVGPGAVSAYEEVKTQMIRGMQRGCQKHG